MFQSIDDVISRLAEYNYVSNRNAATVVFLSCSMRKPVLIEGPAGVGKTELGKVLANSLNLHLIRLQCYEGLDEAKALYEWEYGKQLLYTQILKDKIGETIQGARSLRDAADLVAKEDEVFFSEKFLLARPLLRAILAPEPTVLLIDEVDKADAEFEAFLLEVLSDFQVSVPELGTITARQIPFVVLTSNNTREMSDALQRRCLHLHLDFPEPDMEKRIVKMRIPEVEEKLAEEVVQILQRFRKLDLKKVPSISETLDWVKALTLLNVDKLDHDLVEETLSTLLKHETDIRKAQEELKRYLAERQTQRSSPSPQEDKDLLH